MIMNRISFHPIIITLFIFIFAMCSAPSERVVMKRIAHRGGVVENEIPENSKEALLQAAKKNYWGVELDMRITKDSVLIAHHDPLFLRYYGVAREVTEMRWDEISRLVSDSGTKVQKLEDAMSLCAKVGLNVMIDNKVEGLPISVFDQLIDLLDRHNLRKKALMIGTSASTEHFTGKIRLSCTRKQLEQNMLRNDYNPDNYYFFGNPTKDDAAWAKKNNIMVVGVINEWAIKKESEQEEVETIIQNLKLNGIEFVQLDSKYDRYFITE